MISSIFNEQDIFNKSEAREYEDECIEDEEEKRRIHSLSEDSKNQLIDLMQPLEGYTKFLPVFGFNSDRYDINFMKSYFTPYLINEEETKPSVIKKANGCSFKLGDVQLLDNMKLLGRATTSDSFLGA